MKLQINNGFSIFFYYSFIGLWSFRSNDSCWIAHHALSCYWSFRELYFNMQCYVPKVVNLVWSKLMYSTHYKTMLSCPPFDRHCKTCQLEKLRPALTVSTTSPCMAHVVLNPSWVSPAYAGRALFFARNAGKQNTVRLCESANGMTPNHIQKGPNCI